jgi:hypothetical protein
MLTLIGRRLASSSLGRVVGVIVVDQMLRIMEMGYAPKIRLVRNCSS